MQNKGIIRLVAILLSLACLYQLSFTYVSRKIENRATEYAQGFPAELQESKKQSYLDSLKSEKVYLGFSLKQVKDKEINLGLDLRGGMNVMLEISVEDVVRALSNYSKDPIFNDALAKAREDQNNSTEDYITLFAKAYNQLSNGAPLAYIFNTQELREKVTPNSTNEQVIGVLKAEADSAISNSYNVLRSRIDRFGVAQPNIQRIGTTGRILVELPGVKEPERVRKLLQGTASLEFWPTYDNTEVFGMLEEANSIVREAERFDSPAEESTIESTSKENADLLDKLNETESGVSGAQEFAKQNPLFAKLTPRYTEQGPARGAAIGHAFAYDTAAVNKLFAMPQVKMILPRDMKLMWGVKGIDEAETMFELYAIRANTRDGKAPLDGAAVSDARGQYNDQKGSRASVSMLMTPTGKNTWARMTAENIGKSIAIVLDGYVYSAPVVNNEITTGSSEITGDFTIQDATDLANVLKSGKLPAPARITQEAVVGPSLGQDSINSSMISFVFAFLMVLLYMIFFYNKAGWTASLALILNLFFIFGILASFGAVLTLPGIAGIVLTMAMAVDSNVIIYERIKEELRAGKSISAALAAGYKVAMSAIIDFNLTSLIIGIVLFAFGTGPVQGFATTYIIGIFTSFFTSIFVTRLLFAGKIRRDKKLKFSNRLTENFLSNTKINFIKIRKISYAITLLVVIASIASIMTKGMNMGVDFTGGRTYVVRFDQVVSPEEVRAQISDAFASEDSATQSTDVKQFGATSQMQMRIVTQFMHGDLSKDASLMVEGKLFEALKPLYADNTLTFEDFQSSANSAYGIISADMVGPSVAHDITRNSFIAIFLSLVAIGLYIFMRFKNWEYGVGSTIALAIDAFMTVGLFSILHGVLPFNLEVNQTFIAAILTIIGYSINDKVVIFDRIREYNTLYPKRSIRDNMNNAINSTLSRTINTSGSTVIVLLAIFLFGGEVIRGFIFALLFGVIIGTLSSIFTATPAAYSLFKNPKAKKALFVIFILSIVSLIGFWVKTDLINGVIYGFMTFFILLFLLITFYIFTGKEEKIEE